MLLDKFEVFAIDGKPYTIVRLLVKVKNKLIEKNVLIDFNENVNLENYHKLLCSFFNLFSVKWRENMFNRVKPSEVKLVRILPLNKNGSRFN